MATRTETDVDVVAGDPAQRRLHRVGVGILEIVPDAVEDRGDDSALLVKVHRGPALCERSFASGEVTEGGMLVPSRQEGAPVVETILNDLAGSQPLLHGDQLVAEGAGELR